MKISYFLLSCLDLIHQKIINDFDVKIKENFYQMNDYKTMYVYIDRVDYEIIHMNIISMSMIILFYFLVNIYHCRRSPDYM